MSLFEKFIKNKLNSFEYNSIQSDWDKFKKKLPNKKPIISRYITIGAVAAILLISLTFILNKENIKQKENKTQITEQNKNNEKLVVNSPILKNEEVVTNNNDEIIREKTTLIENTKEQNDENNIETPKQDNIVENEVPNEKEIILDAEIDDYSPISDFDILSHEGCLPFEANITAKDNHQNVSFCWEFSDGYKSKNKNIKHTFKKAGKYIVKLTTKYNCKINTSEQEITVYEVPESKFNYTVKNETYYFNGPDNSKLKWNFGDNTTSTEIDPEHNYKLIGNMEVKLISLNSHACKSEFTQTINVEPIFQIANAFSPDNNGYNDAFGPIFEYPENYDFELYIYNSQGKLYFKSFSANQSWNGKINNTDQTAEKGYYIWKLLINDKEGNKIIRNGNLNIKR
jgi:PKD repeat protein